MDGGGLAGDDTVRDRGHHGVAARRRRLADTSDLRRPRDHLAWGLPVRAGFEKPITSFTVKDGRVVRVFMAAVAD
jgi:hypothetical protein